VQYESVMGIQDLLGNEFKYDICTSVGKLNQQERKVYPQV
jgi:hypothetical protein